MKTMLWFLAALFVFLFAFHIFASNHRIVAVVPYCFDGEFGQSGGFKLCSEVDRYYEV